MSIVNDLDSPFGRTFSVIWFVKQFLIESGREDEVAMFLEEANASDQGDLKEVASKYVVDIDWSSL